MHSENVQIWMAREKSKKCLEYNIQLKRKGKRWKK